MKKIIALLLILALSLSSIAATYTYSELEVKVLELEQRIEALEARFTPAKNVGGMFSGQGNSQTLPFTVTSVPWELRWQAELSVAGSCPFGGNIYNINTDNGTIIRHVGNIGSYTIHGGDVRTGRTYIYYPAGTYYLDVSTTSQISWDIWIDDGKADLQEN